MLLIDYATGHIACVAFLLKAGSQLNLVTKSAVPETALALAVRKRHQLVVKQLLEAGADANLTFPLYSAALLGEEGIVQLLIAHKVNVNARREDDSTALYAAAQEGHAAIIDRLAAAGADLNAMKKGKISALYIAAQVCFFNS